MERRRRSTSRSFLLGRTNFFVWRGLWLRGGGLWYWMRVLLGMFFSLLVNMLSKAFSWLNSVALNSVDTATDRSIHKLVCEDLKDLTVISVMHRLENVELYDMVAVHEEDRFVEFGRPKELLSDPVSAFSGLYLNGTDS
jgi:hypothetical protein